MAAVVKGKKRKQQSNQKKSRTNQMKRKQTEAKQKKKARSKQATKRVKKPLKKKSSLKDKECQLTNKAKGVLGSYVEGLCKVVSSEAERLRKEKCEPEISGQVLQAALEQSISKGDIRQAVTPAAKRTKRKRGSSVEDDEKVPSPPERQAAPNQKLPKQRKQSTTSVAN